MTWQYKIHYVKGPAGATVAKTFACSPFSRPDRRSAYLSASRLSDVIRAHGGWSIDIALYELPEGDHGPQGLS